MIGPNEWIKPGLAIAALVVSGCASPETPESHVGTWVVDGVNENEILLFTFFEDGTYLHAEYDAEEAGGERSGMEWGTISTDDEGVVGVDAARFDGNGDTGLTDFVGTSDLKCTVDGGILTLDVIGGPDSGDSIQFTRLESIGASGTFTSTETENELLAFTFLPGDRYCHFEYDDQPGDEINGMECSAYSLGQDNVMTLSEADVLVDNNGDTGLTDFVGTSDLQVTFTAESMTLEIVGGEDAPDSFVLDRAP